MDPLFPVSYGIVLAARFMMRGLK